MEGSLPFSALNDRLRPHSTLQRLYAPPSVWEDRQTPRPLREGPSGGGARPTPYQGRPDPEESNAGSEEPAEEDSETGSLDSDGGSSMNEDQGNRSDLLSLLTQCLDPAMRLTDTGSEGLEEPAEGRPDASSSSSSSAERSSDLPEGSSSPAARETGRGADPRGADRSLPDLLRGSGRPLSRRRTLGPVSDTLKEVRREVALSRSRSIRLKAQVDKLQEEGPGWSQHRERVTEEVLSVLKLLRPLSDARLVEPSSSADRLDAGLSQLQHVARSLALSHGNQSSGVGKRSEDMAILEQALRDRDEAIEKKKGMEAELLRSKSEMMHLNNQLLEAVQKRLELSLELEAWKEDLQYILNQQLQQQQQSQQAEESQKRSRGGLLRRTNRVPVQRPDPPAPAPAPNPSPPPPPPPPAVTKAFPSDGFSSLSRAFKDRFRRGKVGRQGDQEPAGPDVQQASATGFQTVSLD
ncbi:bicaudal-D-related protein 2-like [Gadus macrocephalus]|uniref:bicaudal-D-related protein 2-like n=1 Tax=Gadus macrocephalus TaxID=80720 RepID=UPI0028CB1986|nr:bicaudal-D-related protein 2-like [Gadus macrocephalus]